MIKLTIATARKGRSNAPFTLADSSGRTKFGLMVFNPETHRHELTLDTEPEKFEALSRQIALSGLPFGFEVFIAGIAIDQGGWLQGLTDVALAEEVQRRILLAAETKPREITFIDHPALPKGEMTNAGREVAYSADAALKAEQFASLMKGEPILNAQTPYMRLVSEAKKVGVNSMDYRGKGAQALVDAIHAAMSAVRLNGHAGQTVTEHSIPVSVS